MKKEWTNEETKHVLRTIKKWLNSRKFMTREGRVPERVTIKELGLPYTSSGKCAGVWVTNTYLWLDDERVYHVYGFVMNDYGTVFALCYNVNENELIIPISQ